MVVALGIAAAAGNAVLVVARTCDACWQDLVIYGLGLPLALAAFLAAWFGAIPMVMRRALLLAGLVVAVNVYLNVVRARNLGSTDELTCVDMPVAACGEAIGVFGVGWNLAFSVAIVAVCLWGTFARPPRDGATG
jgi:hypothetical protein